MSLHHLASRTMNGSICTFKPKGSGRYATVLVMQDLVDAWPAVFSVEELRSMEADSPGITDRCVLPGSMKVCSRGEVNSFAFDPLAQCRVIEKALGPSWKVDFTLKKGSDDPDLTLRSPDGLMSAVKTSADGESLAQTAWFFQDENAARRTFEFIESKKEEILEHRYSLYRDCTWITKLLSAVKKPDRSSAKKLMR